MQLLQENNKDYIQFMKLLQEKQSKKFIEDLENLIGSNDTLTHGFKELFADFNKYKAENTLNEYYIEKINYKLRKLLDPDLQYINEFKEDDNFIKKNIKDLKQIKNDYLKQTKIELIYNLIESAKKHIIKIRNKKNNLNPQESILNINKCIFYFTLIISFIFNSNNIDSSTGSGKAYFISIISKFSVKLLSSCSDE
jgi:hypothetical protein